MIRIPKSVVSFGAVAVVAGGLTLAVPRAAHALAAALVQVANTPASPAITQSANGQAAQLVQLSAIVNPSNPFGQVFGGLTAGHQLTSPYSAPNNQSLVVTAVDVSPPANCTSGSFSVKLSSTAGELPLWTASAPSTGHFEYPSGIVFSPGATPNIQNVFTNNIGGPFCNEAIVVNLYGYLTFN
jgi:hypothetical protein